MGEFLLGLVGGVLGTIATAFALDQVTGGEHRRLLTRIGAHSQRTADNTRQTAENTAVIAESVASDTSELTASYHGRNTLDWRLMNHGPGLAKALSAWALVYNGEIYHAEQAALAQTVPWELGPTSTTVWTDDPPYEIPDARGYRLVIEWDSGGRRRRSVYEASKESHAARLIEYS